MAVNIPLNRFSADRIAKFHSRVNCSGGPDSCWEWTASTDGNGYGKMKVDGGACIRAHRIAYFIAKGTDPADRMVCHSCDNPPCCNPAHLWLGDNSANQRDCIAKGRKPKMDMAGEKNGNAKLSEGDIEKVRAMILAGANNKAIGRVFGVTHQCISRVRRGRSWGSEPMQAKYASLRR